MDKPVRAVVNCETGEQTLVELTDEEIANLKKLDEQFKADRAKEEAEAQAKAEAKASAEAKLVKLGLTDEEVKAILG